MCDEQPQDGQHGYGDHRGTVLAQYYSLIGCLDQALEAGILDGNSILESKGISGDLSYEGIIESIEESNRKARIIEEERERRETKEYYEKRDKRNIALSDKMQKLMEKREDKAAGRKDSILYRR